LWWVNHDTELIFHKSITLRRIEEIRLRPLEVKNFLSDFVLKDTRLIIPNLCPKKNIMLNLLIYYRYWLWQPNCRFELKKSWYIDALNLKHKRLEVPVIAVYYFVVFFVILTPSYNIVLTNTDYWVYLGWLLFNHQSDAAWTE